MRITHLFDFSTCSYVQARAAREKARLPFDARGPASTKPSESTAGPHASSERVADVRTYGPRRASERVDGRATCTSTLPRWKFHLSLHQFRSRGRVPQLIDARERAAHVTMHRSKRILLLPSDPAAASTKPRLWSIREYASTPSPNPR
jgi:hypothetical protein